MIRRHRTRTAVALALATLLSLSACSSHAAPAPLTAQAAATPAPQPTGPSAAVCAAASELVDGAQPDLTAAADESVGQQASYLSGFYTQLLSVLPAAGAADPVSGPVQYDAAALSNDYGTLSGALQSADASGASVALQSLVGDLAAMRRDQVAFDAACGIPAIVR